MTCSVSDSAPELTRRQQAGERHGTGSSDVVVERRRTAAVALEHLERDVLGEVLPLDDRLRPAPLDSIDETVEQREILVAAQPRFVHAEVVGGRRVSSRRSVPTSMLTGMVWNG